MLLGMINYSKGMIYVYIILMYEIMFEEEMVYGSSMDVLSLYIYHTSFIDKSSIVIRGKQNPHTRKQLQK